MHIANFFVALVVVLAAVAFVESLALSSLAIRLLYRNLIPGWYIWKTMVKAGHTRVANLFADPSLWAFRRSGPREKPGWLWKVWAVVYYPLVTFIVSPVRWYIRLRLSMFESVLVFVLSCVIAGGWILYKAKELGFVIVLITALVVAGYILYGIAWVVIQLLRATLVNPIRAAYRKRHPLPPPPPPKPVVYTCTVNKLTVLVRAEDHASSKVLHDKCVRDGLKTSNDPIIVRPCFVFYHESAKLTQEERKLLAGRLSEMDDITKHCTVYEKNDIYVPFASPKYKVRQHDRALFFGTGECCPTAFGARKIILEGYPSFA